MDEKNIGEMLHNERKRRKLTLKQVGEMLNISMDYVSRIEKGERAPSKIVIAAIDEFLTNGSVAVNEQLTPYGDQAKRTRSPIRAIAEEKLNAMSDKELEDLVFELMKRERERTD